MISPQYVVHYQSAIDYTNRKQKAITFSCFGDKILVYVQNTQKPRWVSDHKKNLVGQPNTQVDSIQTRPNLDHEDLEKEHFWVKRKSKKKEL